MTDPKPKECVTTFSVKTVPGSPVGVLGPHGCDKDALLASQAKEIEDLRSFFQRMADHFPNCGRHNCSTCMDFLLNARALAATERKP